MGSPVKKLLFAFLLASSPANASDPFAAIHTVAIESSLGDKLILKQDADIFGATAPDMPLPTGADIDGYVTSQIRAAVADRFTVVDPSANPDAIIAVRPEEIDQHMYAPVVADFSYSGLSLTHSKGLFGKYTILLSAQFSVSVADTKTGKQIAFGPAKGPATGIFGAQPDPIEFCNRALWPTSPATPSADEIEQISADLMAIIAMSLPNALVRAGLSTHGNDVKLTDWNGRKLLCTDSG